MKELETDRPETTDPASTETDQSPEMIRRDFLKRFGLYAAGTGVGLFILMSPRASIAGSDGGPI